MIYICGGCLTSDKKVCLMQLVTLQSAEVCGMKLTLVKVKAVLYILCLQLPFALQHLPNYFAVTHSHHKSKTVNFNQQRQS